MPGGANCAAGICCPPGSPDQEAALTEIIAEDLGALDTDMEAVARHVARKLLARFDVVPKGWWPQCVEALKKLLAEEADG